MLEYLNGQIIEINPAHVVLDLNGVGYYINISLNDYSALSGKKTIKLMIHELIREDAHTLYGFTDVDDRQLFRHLISVSGVGATTGILFLSSLQPAEIHNAIISGDVDKLKSVKGVGLKTAQRLIVELKDKLSKSPVSTDIFANPNNTAREEALSALITLGFVKKNAEKVLEKLIRQDPNQSVENLIKSALSQM